MGKEKEQIQMASKQKKWSHPYQERYTYKLSKNEVSFSSVQVGKEKSKMLPKMLTRSEKWVLAHTASYSEN